MDVPRPVPPSFMQRDLERMGVETCGLHPGHTQNKISRSQKRQRRLQQQSVRDALIHSRSLLSQQPFVQVIPSKFEVRGQLNRTEPDLGTRLDLLERMLS